jgi:hypothetical protein
MEKSETISTLSAALVKFSGKMTKVKKDSVNPHFRNTYASLSNIIEATQQPLHECGLAVVQMPTGENELTTVLLHESGEYISSTYKMTPSKNDPQGLGSAITYQRRYAYGAILSLNIDEDDDGNAGTKAPEKPEQKPVITEQMSEVVFNGICKKIESGNPDEIEDARKLANAYKTPPRGMKKEYAEKIRELLTPKSK